MHIFAVRDFQVHGLKDREHILLNPCVSLVIPVTYEDLHSDCNNRTRRQFPPTRKHFMTTSPSTPSTMPSPKSPPPEAPSPSPKPKSDKAWASSPPSKTPKETSSASTSPQRNSWRAITP